MGTKPAWKNALGYIAAFFVVVSVAASIGILMRENPIHVEFAKQCVMKNGSIRTLNGVTFCAHITPIPDMVWLGTRSMSEEEQYKFTHACMSAGGQKFDFSRDEYDIGCYKITIVEELGARNDYVPSN